MLHPSKKNKKKTHVMTNLQTSMRHEICYGIKNLSIALNTSDNDGNEEPIPTGEIKKKKKIEIKIPVISTVSFSPKFLRQNTKL